LQKPPGLPTGVTRGPAGEPLKLRGAQSRTASEAALAVLDFLDQSILRGEPDIPGIQLEPALRTLHAEPRYQAMVAQAGFSPENSHPGSEPFRP